MIADAMLTTVSEVKCERNATYPGSYKISRDSSLASFDSTDALLFFIVAINCAKRVVHCTCDEHKLLKYGQHPSYV